MSAWLPMIHSLKESILPSYGMISHQDPISLDIITVQVKNNEC